MKAFLSYSSEDKAYVEVVAKRLGRMTSELDAKSFPPGYDFRNSIRNSLSKSNIFVLFASRKSLESTWVKFEFSEAEWQTIHEQILGAIVIIIDSDLRPTDLPKWMQRCLAPVILNPRSAVHVIRNFMVQLDNLLEPIFVGRETDMAKYSKELSPNIEMESPRVLVLGGLEGIGRKTFGRHVISNYLSLNMGPVFEVEETDTIDTLYLQLVNYTSDLTSRGKLAQIIKAFDSLNDEEKGQEVARLLAVINKENIIPVIFNKGTVDTLIDVDTNWYKYEWQSILEGLNKFEDSYVLVVHLRLPYVRNIPNGVKIPPIAQYRLGHLDIDAIKHLLRESIRREELEATTEQITEIAPYINGYPPAAQLVLGYIKNYGFDILLADKGMLTSFLARRFETFIESLKLSSKENQILIVLAADLALPLEAIQVIVECSDIETAQMLRHLIDLNLVVVVDSDYAISPPIQVSIIHNLGYLTRKDYSKLAKVLREKFWTDEEELPKLSIVDTIIHALAYSDLAELDEFKDITLPAQLFKVATQKYRARDWRGATTLSKRALQLNDALHGARVILFKSLVRQRYWREADQVLIKIDQEHRRERFYLRGFFEWKQGHANVALNWFRSGWEAGDQSLSILRDSAYCSFVSGKMNDARFYINRALGRTRNKYLLDLAAQIAIFSDNIPDAEKYLAELQHIDEVFFYNRRGTLKYKQGKYPEAFEDVEKAFKADYPLLDIRIQRIVLMIILDMPQAEQEISNIEKILGDRSDVTRALWCNYYLQKGQWSIAEDYLRKIWQKELPSFKELRRVLLEQKKEDVMIPASERKDAETELSEYQDIIKLPVLDPDIT